MSDRPGLRLGATRVSLGLTQQQAAHILGVPKGTYASWEHGRGAEPEDACARLLAAEETPPPLRRGRPRTRGVMVRLSPEALAVWDALPREERDDWVSELIASSPR